MVISASHRHRWTPRRLRTIIVVLGLLSVLLVRPTPATAGSPFTNRQNLPPRGGGAGSVTIEAPVQQGDTPNLNNPLAWLPLALNPGKWLIDSVLGAFSGVLYSTSSVFETLGRFGAGQVVEMDGAITSASDTVFNLLFTTPEQITVDWSSNTGIGSPRALHDIVRQMALSLLVLILTYRALFVLVYRNFREGLVDLLIAAIGGIVGVQSSWWLVGLCIKAANLMSEKLIGAAFGGGIENWVPLDPVTLYWGSLTQGTSLAIAVVTLVYWAMLGMLALHALARIVLVNVMLIVAPLAGLSIATGGGWNYARVWFFRFVELLSTPIIWGLTLGFAHSLLHGFGVTAHPILGPILAIFAMYLTFKTPRLLGIAAQEAVTGMRTLTRHSERLTSVWLTRAVLGGSAGAAAAAATATAAAPASGPTIVVDRPTASSASAWLPPLLGPGPSSSGGTPPPPPALPPGSGSHGPGGSGGSGGSGIGVLPDKQ